MEKTMDHHRIDKPMPSSETDEYDKNYFIRVLLVVVIFTLIQFYKITIS